MPPPERNAQNFTQLMLPNSSYQMNQINQPPIFNLQPDPSGQPCLERCSKESVLYQAICTRCEAKQIDEGNSDPIQRLYLGETSRTLVVRSNQHFADYRRALSTQKDGVTTNPDNGDSEDISSSWMYDHSVDTHNGPGDSLKDDYMFNILKSHRDPLTREIEESVRIQRALEKGVHTAPNSKETHIISLNRKGEAFAPNPRWDSDRGHQQTRRP